MAESSSSLSGDALEKAKKELGEVPEKREEEVRKFREAIEAWKPEAGQEEVQFSRKDGPFLLRFLRARKFNTERALQLYVNFHFYRAKHAKLLGDLSDVESVRYILDSGLICVLDQCSRSGCKVLLFQSGRWDIPTMPIGDLMKVLLLILDRLIEEEETQVHGFALIEDLSGADFFKLMHMARLEHELQGILFELIQDAFPGRFKAIHLVNQPWYISVIMAILRPFMKQKIRERIHMHGSDYSTLHEFLDPAHLPAEFDGQQPPLDSFSAARLFA